MELFDFVNRANADYIDRLYQQYQKDPRSTSRGEATSLGSTWAWRARLA
jgi:2-oxoglutarate dehydrogenase complex dehydrogenase (E1) component-like enzyme